MANLSDANGTITMMANDKESVIELLKAFEHFRFENIKSDYYTNIKEAQDGIDNAVQLIKEIDREYKYELCVNFEACGRWQYLNNIEHMFHWILNDPGFKDLKMIDILEESDFAIDFDFDDYEPGCELDSHFTIRLTHEKGKDLVDCKLIEEEYVNEIHRGREM